MSTTKDTTSIFQYYYKKYCATFASIDLILTTNYNFIPISISTLRKRRKRRSTQTITTKSQPTIRPTTMTMSMTMTTKLRVLPSQITSVAQTFGKSLLTSLFKCIAMFYPVIVLLFILNSNKNCNSKSMILFCDAVPMPTSLALPPSPSALLLSIDDGALAAERVSLQHVAAAVQRNQVVNLTRQHGGDVFDAFGKHFFLL